jgi:hypothetical protein
VRPKRLGYGSVHSEAVACFSVTCVACSPDRKRRRIRATIKASAGGTEDLMRSRRSWACRTYLSGPLRGSSFGLVAPSRNGPREGGPP